MLTKEKLKIIYENFEKWRNIDFSKKYENAFKRIFEKYKITQADLIFGIDIINYTKFNMKYYK